MINWVIKHWPTLDAFEQHLATLERPSWVRGLTTHHTASPTVEQWKGRATMDWLGPFYEAKGWSAGPHLFIGPDGIWQGTPLTDVGVHAGPCNDTRLGLEIVGNYMTAPWQEPIRSLALGAHAALLRWLGLDCSVLTVVGHRDCMPGKTSCPGDAIDMRVVRADIAALMIQRAQAEDNPQVLALPPGPLPISRAAWLRSFARHQADQRGLSVDAQNQLYGMCEWLRVHPAFLIGLLLLETRLGRSAAGPSGNNWLNVRELDSRAWGVTIGAITYERWGTAELNIASQIIEWAGRYAYQDLTTLREVLTLWLSPHAQDGDSVERAATQVLETMRYVASH